MNLYQRHPMPHVASWSMHRCICRVWRDRGAWTIGPGNQFREFALRQTHLQFRLECLMLVGTLASSTACIGTDKVSGSAELLPENINMQIKTNKHHCVWTKVAYHVVSVHRICCYLSILHHIRSRAVCYHWPLCSQVQTECRSKPHQSLLLDGISIDLILPEELCMRAEVFNVIFKKSSGDFRD